MSKVKAFVHMQAKRAPRPILVPIRHHDRARVYCCSVTGDRHLNCAVYGATENARHENTGRSKMQGWKMRDMNLRRQLARVENARHEFAAPDCRGEKCET